MSLFGARARPSLLLVVATASLACSRSAPSFTDDSTDDGGPPNFGPYDPYTGGEPPQTTSSSSSSSTTVTTDAPPPDVPGDGACNLIDDPDCPSGQKCVPDAWNCCGLFECVPIEGEGQIGDACSNSGPGSNIDDCGANSYCLEGECRGFCDPFGECPGDALCLSDFNGPVWVCIDQCDPVLQDCGPGEGCYYRDEFYGFNCRTPNDGESGLGEPCDGFSQTCTAGLSCVPADAYPGGCNGDGCCSPWCDIEVGCINGPPGTECTHLAMPNHPWLGVCTGTAIPLQPGDLQIVEVYADPPGITIYEAPFEYIEIVNRSASPIDLAPLELDDYVGNTGPISQRHPTVLGDGGCADISSYCLAPGRRALFVGSGYAEETNGALVLVANNIHVLGSLLQPFTRLKLRDANFNMISSYRLWDDPYGDPLPSMELPMHRIDEAGPDTPDNWAEGPATPGL